MPKAIFITATDTGAGKTVISCALGLALKKKGIDVGVMKPFQCSGNDADFLIKTLEIKDEKSLVNPYYAKEPLAPYVAFKRARIKIDLEKIFNAYKELKKRHEFLIVEGAGGLLVPIKENYLTADLIRDLDIPALIVARAGLGTLNHSLITQRYALDYGIKVKGVILNGFKGKTLAEKTNPRVLRDFLDVPLLAVVPFVKNVNSKKGLSALAKELGRSLSLESLLKKERTRTKRLRSDDKLYLWHPFTQMKDWIKDRPLIIEEAKGCYLKDTEGRWYLDGVSSLWVNVHGHRKPEIDAAIAMQMRKSAHSTLLGLAHPPAIDLARELVRIAPYGLRKVFYSDSGSSAVEIALKMAYQYWQHLGSRKRKFIHLENAYHGDTIGAVSVGGIDLFHKAYKDLLFDSYTIDSPYCYRCPTKKLYPLCDVDCLGGLREILECEHEQVAALIVEPLVQGASGMLAWPKGIYKKMAGLCKKYNVLLIADEVAVGIGRTGTMFASEQEEVTPDILCLAKGITAGYLPLAATLTTNEIFDAFLGEHKEQKTFFHGHTYTGNPLACAAALANLQLFRKEKTLKKLQPKIKFLSKELERFKRLEHTGDIRQKGFMVGIELVKDRLTKEPYPWEEKIGIKVCQKAREYGVILRPLGNVIVLMPPLAISKEELSQLLGAAYKAISFVTG
ncbi:adenosylmethionine--8-amino-7-oxononanoate transaminase [bacterium]|nr:MAG: adenosylmethionine--8-amino-7-oxononanoate transaminase [bacterium]